MSDPVNDPVPQESKICKDPFPWTDMDMVKSFLYGMIAGVAVTGLGYGWL